MQEGNETTFNGTFNEHLLITDTSLRKLARYLDYYFVPCIITAGLVGNTLSFLVFTFTNLKKLSSSVYLAALSISDSGFLICVFFSWANNINVTLYHKQGWCQMFVYMTYIFSFLSVWYIVVFSCERFIAVRWPFKRSEICTPRKAKFVVVALALLAGLAYTFAIWTSDVSFVYSTFMCLPQEEHKVLLERASYADTVITLIIPFVAILFFNCGIIVSVRNFATNYQQWQFNNQELRKAMVRTKSSDSTSPQIDRSRSPQTRHIYVEQQGSSGKVAVAKSTSVCSSHCGSTHQKGQAQRHHQLHVTKMLLAVSSIFLLLNLPSHVIRMYDFCRKMTDPTYSTTLTVIRLQKIFTYVYYTNFSINFILYSLCGRNFRKALRGLVNWQRIKTCCRKTKRQNSLLSRNSKSVVSTKV